MRSGSIRVNGLQIGTLALATALLACAPAFADTTATVSPTKTSSAVTSKTTTATTGDSNSAIQTPVDKQTEAFRAELAAKRARLDAFNAQLDALDTELEIASQQYDAASDQLAQMKTRVQVAESDVTNARAAYTLQMEILGKRATSIYKEGTLGGVEVLLDSKSVGDFVERVKFLNTIGLADADVATSLKAQKDMMEKQLVELKNTEAQAEALEFEMKARKIEVELRIQERQQMMAATQGDLSSLLGVEAVRRTSDQSALLQQALSGANKAGIVVTPGSPVETALAYHGVPYVWAGATPSGFDCSGLILYVFAQHGVTLPHYSGSQILLGEKIDLAAIQPNDVVFFGSPVHHVGLYCGGGYFIEAPHTGAFVRISKLSDRNDIAGVRRYAWTPRVGAPKGGVTTAASALGSVR